MDWSDVVRLLVSVAVAGVALGVVRFGLRLVRIDLMRVPTRGRNVLAVGFLTCVTTVCLAALSLSQPPGVAAATGDTPSPDESAVADLASSTSPFRVIRVYDFENWGEHARRHEVGATLARNILVALRDDGLNAKRGREIDLPVGLYEDRDTPPADLIRHYSKLAPFVCVSGYVSTRKDGRFEVEVAVSAIDRTARSSTLLKRTLAFTESSESMQQTSNEIAAAVIALAAEGE